MSEAEFFSNYVDVKNISTKESSSNFADDGIRFPFEFDKIYEKQEASKITSKEDGTKFWFQPGYCQLLGSGYQIRIA